MLGQLLVGAGQRRADADASGMAPCPRRWRVSIPSSGFARGSSCRRASRIASGITGDRCGHGLTTPMAIPLSYNVRNVRQRWKVTAPGHRRHRAGRRRVRHPDRALQRLPHRARLDRQRRERPSSSSAAPVGAHLGHRARRRGVPQRRRARRARRRRAGPLASPEIVVAASLPRRGGAMETNVQLRGVSPMAFKVRDGIEIIEGRLLTPGPPARSSSARASSSGSSVALGSTLRIKSATGRSSACSARRAAASRPRSGATWA